jgi:RNA polymerase sigma-70 factor (ECF subfamily)
MALVRDDVTRLVARANPNALAATEAAAMPEARWPDKPAWTRLSSVIDERVRGLIDAGNAAGAAQLIVETYGVEVFGYLMTLVKSEELAGEAFAVACEDMLKAVLRFRGESSVRTWVYTIVRHAAYREARGVKRRRAENISGLADVLQAPMRTATATFRRTEVKDEFSKLRDALSPEERELLLLRVDRGLSWAEIAQIQQEDGASAEDLKREAARFRKQFERTKEKLRQLAEQAGLLQDKG